MFVGSSGGWVHSQFAFIPENRESPRSEVATRVEHGLRVAPSADWAIITTSCHETSFGWPIRQKAKD